MYSLLEDEMTTGNYFHNNSKTAIRLFLLSSLVPPRHRARTGKTFWKPSIAETRDGLFLQVKVPGDIETSKLEKRKFLYKKGLTVQPYIVVVGPTLTNIYAFYVIIKDKNYQTNTLFDAIKFCFQTYFVFDLKYPTECQHLWYLMQWELFNVTYDKDIKIPFLNDILQCKY
ncbi:hypothetical protein PUN28_013912 [Cardiocondyla obscurior]|uniref:Uncharacterized protein n=1 Tax=Cardiocondyla obscurior TaxID=286306 RepID=A0AAW2F8X9_9HYME